MTQFRTPQEDFWAGSFGNEYVTRNQDATWIAKNLALFSQILPSTYGIESVIEYGANIGLNLIALKQLLPQARFAGVEINEKAAQQLKSLGYVEVHHGSILEHSPTAAYDLVLTKGVLIHLNPEHLPAVYDLLYRSSKHFICIAEYYNPTPVTVTYRGHSDRLYKRDFSGEMLDRYQDLKLVKYGFVYHRDYLFPQDDINWFLLEKQNSAARGGRT